MHINYELNNAHEEIQAKRIEDQLNQPILQQRIKLFEERIRNEVCSNLPNAFWHRKKHTVNLPYIKGFDERKIPTKARPIQMNSETLEFCQSEIKDLLQKGIIRKSKSPWSCSAFYVQKNAELERGAPRLRWHSQTKVHSTQPEQLVRFHSGVWTSSQINYSAQNSIPDFLTREFLQGKNDR
ncbi:hypothetical protein SLA2020_272450 [Shorea laevis]